MNITRPELVPNGDATDRPFLGWRMVGVGFFVDFVAVGFFFYSYSVFFKGIAAEFGDSRLGVSLGLTITQGVGALLAPLIGRALDRYPLRRIIGAGATSMACGFLLLGFVETPLQFYLILGSFIGFGSGAMGSFATAKLIANWFDRKRGFALGIATTGISVSGVVMPAISAAIIMQLGWRSGFLIYAVFTAFIVVPVVLKLVITKPEDVGQHPDGADHPSTIHPSHANNGSTGVLKQPNFWVLVLSMGFLYCTMGATMTHMVPRLTDAGYSLIAASAGVSACAGAGVAGKLIFGWFADRSTPRTGMLVVALAQFCGQAVMLFTDSYFGFLAGAVVFGFGMGGVMVLQASVVANLFGRDAFGKVMGLMRPAMLPLHASGVPIAGWVYDATGSYDNAFGGFLGLYVLAAIAISMLKVVPDDRVALAPRTG